mmetsp:Transcript_71703/g.130827  ORF Transcript_71703/g.130827 Transcript_71703/m.130827 type:complete len:128 (+) Transcript_71703:2-385(+)
MEVEVASRAEQKKPTGNAAAKDSADKVAFEIVGEDKVCCEGPSYELYVGMSNNAGYAEECSEECADIAECCGYKFKETVAAPRDGGGWECIHIMHGKDTSKTGVSIPSQPIKQMKKVCFLKKVCKKA